MIVCASVCVTRHGQAAAAAPTLILAQLSVQLGLGGSGCGGRQVRVAQLPEEEGRWGRKLLLGTERERKDKDASEA